MKDNKAREFDLDEWMNLAKMDPEAFEERRREAIRELIDNAPEHLKKRLEGLQWRIDMERNRCKTPLEACIKLHDMLMDHFYGENGLVDTINRLLCSHTCKDDFCQSDHGNCYFHKKKNGEPAKVIPLRRRAGAS